MTPDDRSRLHPLYLQATVIMVCSILTVIWTFTGMITATSRHRQQMDVACHQIAPDHRPQVCDGYIR